MYRHVHTPRHVPGEDLRRAQCFSVWFGLVSPFSQRNRGLACFAKASLKLRLSSHSWPPPCLFVFPLLAILFEVHCRKFAGLDVHSAGLFADVSCVCMFLCGDEHVSFFLCLLNISPTRLRRGRGMIRRIFFVFCPRSLTPGRLSRTLL